MKKNNGFDLDMLVPKRSEESIRKSREFARRLKDPKERDAARAELAAMRKEMEAAYAEFAAKHKGQHYIDSGNLEWYRAKIERGIKRDENSKKE